MCVKDARLLPRSGNIYACVKKLHALGRLRAEAKLRASRLAALQVEFNKGDKDFGCDAAGLASELPVNRETPAKEMSARLARWRFTRSLAEDARPSDNGALPICGRRRRIS